VTSELRVRDCPRQKWEALERKQYERRLEGMMSCSEKEPLLGVWVGGGEIQETGRAEEESWDQIGTLDPRLSEIVSC